MPQPYQPLFDDSQFDVSMFDPQQFARDLIADFDGTDEEKALLANALTKPAVAGKLKNSVALRSAAQRALDKARTIATDAERVRKENFAWAEENREPLEEWLAQRGDRRHIDRDELPSRVTRGVDEATIRKLLDERDAQWQQRLDQMDQSYTGVLSDSMALMNRWAEEFPGERYPYADLQKFALDRRMSLSNAYDAYVAPKREEKRKTELETIKKSAFEEGRQAALAEREELATVDATGDLGSAFKDNLLGRRTQRVAGADGKPLEGEEAFVARWNQTRGFTRPETSASH